MSGRTRRAAPSAYGAATEDEPSLQEAAPVADEAVDDGARGHVAGPPDGAAQEDAVGTAVTPRELLRTMLLIRRFEERCVELYSGARIRGFMHVYIGEEAVAAGMFAALAPEDAVVSTYREHGHALARGIEPSRLMSPPGSWRRCSAWSKAAAAGAAARCTSSTRRIASTAATASWPAVCRSPWASAWPITCAAQVT
jgi:hypothetical protein